MQKHGTRLDRLNTLKLQTMKSAVATTLDLPLQIPDLTRDPSMDDMIWKIAEDIRASKVTFFFGSGMSCPPPSNLPAGSTLGGLIVERLLLNRVTDDQARELARSFPLEILAEALEKDDNYGRAGLEKFLGDRMSDPNARPHKGHAALAALGPYLKRIYTTNFDTLIEREFDSDGCESLADEQEDYEKIDKALATGIPVVVHLHGIVPNAYSITESDLLNLKVPFLGFLQGNLSSHIFVFVGYSLTDPDLRPVYFAIKDRIQQNRKHAKKTYVVSKVDPGLGMELARKCWNARGFDLIPMDAADFMDHLRIAVRFYEQKEALQEVTTRIHGAKGDLNAVAVGIKGITSRLTDVRDVDALECLEELTRKGGAK